MLIFLLCFFLILYHFQTFGYNLDTNFPIIYSEQFKNTNKNSYFGYSVAILSARATGGPWVQVGAPRGFSASSSVQYPGVVFRCGIGLPCLPLDVDTHNSSRSTYRERYIDKKDNAWLGKVMDISEEQNRYVVCAPRWINHYSRRPFHTNQEYLMQGSCYWSHLNDSTIERLLPLVKKDYKFVRDRGVYNYGEGQAGFSVHLTKSKNKNELLTGAPGVYNWKGIPLIYRDSDYQEPHSNKLVRPRSIISEFSDLNIGNAATTTEVGAFGYLGYSVTSGNFFSKNEILYVAGAPRSKGYKGQILIFKFSSTSNRALLVEKSKQGCQLGEYFGASLTSGDINNDGYDDLIVGAPFHANSKYNEGRIYVFLGHGKGELKIPSSGHIIDGKGIGGQFGTSLMYLPDLDLDGFSDIAVGAPYEETSGVVYIFSGSSDGLLPKPSQRIVGKDLQLNLRGFGISMSKPADIDDNHYYDIAIGAYLSGHAIILRGRPTVAIDHFLFPNVAYIDFNSKTFTMKACYIYKGQFLPIVLNITRTVSVDDLLHRAVLHKNDTLVKILTLKLEQMTCENITLDIKQKIDNIYDPITITLSHQYTEKNRGNGLNMFCPSCPVYNKAQSSKPQTLHIPIALGCKQKHVCISKIFVSANFEKLGKENVFIVGSADYLTMVVNVKNEGENAYMTQVKVNLPEVVHFRSIPSVCVEQNATLLCDVDNPLTQNSQRNILLDLDMKGVNSGKCENSGLNFTVSAVTRSNDINNNSIAKIYLKLMHQADVTITGKSDKQSCFYGSRQNGIATFTQMYQVEKIGSSPLDEVKINITLPIAVHNSETPFLSLFPLEAYLDGQPIICKTNLTLITDNEYATNRSRAKRFVHEDIKLKSEVWKSPSKNEFHHLVNRTFYANCSSGNVHCSSVVCMAGPFNKKQNAAVVQLRMLFNVSSISDILKENSIFALVSDAFVEIIQPLNYIQSGNRPDTVQIVTLFVGETENVQVKLWIPIASAVLGLFLLLLLVIILVKAGFFKRTKKLQLEALKEAEAENFEETDDLVGDINVCDK